jgi:hypothetical protein
LQRHAFRKAGSDPTTRLRIQSRNCQVDFQSQVQGKFVFLSIGMSNASGEFSNFKAAALKSPQVNHSTMVMVDGARGSAVACAWTYVYSAPAANCYSPGTNLFNDVRDQVLAPLGMTEDQVQIVWFLDADLHPATAWDTNKPVPPLPDPSADAFIYQKYVGQIARAVKTRYTHVKQMFISSRVYGGYATTTTNPEPFAYEYGFSTKWTIQAQINQIRGQGTDPISGDLSYSALHGSLGGLTNGLMEHRLVLTA